MPDEADRSDAQRLRILHIEDSEADSLLVQQMLVREGLQCEVERVETREQLEESLRSKSFDLILADCKLPRFSGLEALSLSRTLYPNLPFVFVSGTIGEETAIESVRNGATDYVLKDRLSRLVPAVMRALSDAKNRASFQDMEKRLREAQRLEAIGTLAGGVAHDFNNLLTIISGNASLLKLISDQPARVAAVAETIDRAVQRGSELVRGLLVFARQGQTNLVSIDIAKQVHDTVGMLQATFPENIAIVEEYDSNMPEILADPAQIDRIFINLLANARDAMPNGGTITIAASAVQAGPFPDQPKEVAKDYLRIEVTDTGIGIEESVRQHIFEPFFTTKSSGKGTGLGLPVVYGLMQSHQGFVDVKSEPGVGTAFTLFFPVPSPGESVAVDRGEPLPIHSSGSETILVVEDESDVAKFLETLFGLSGYQVLLARESREALELFSVRQEEIRLVFSDVDLAKVDGFALCTRLKELKPDLKVILTSGHIDRSIEQRQKQYGIDAFVPKPYNPQELVRRVRATLDRPQEH
jgi:two-component system, cell cycle sensor histidine kinase and response regulator CckA